VAKSPRDFERPEFGAGFAHRIKAGGRKSDPIWHRDELFVTLRDEPDLLWRAVDQPGVELDILLRKRPDKGTATRFFKRTLPPCPEAPRKIVTDQLRSYPAAPKIPGECLWVRVDFDLTRCFRFLEAHSQTRAPVLYNCEWHNAESLIQ
jgi:transposase-like protein